MLVLVAGCSSGSSGRSGSTASSQLRTPSSAASSSDDSASLREWGSLIAGIASPVRKAVSDYTSQCTSLDYGSSAPLECTIGPTTIEFSLEAFVIKLDSGRQRLGAPPAELASLVTSTRADAVAAETACKSAANGVSAREDMSSAVAQLGSDLDSWGPYTGS